MEGVVRRLREGIVLHEGILKHRTPYHNERVHYAHEDDPNTKEHGEDEADRCYCGSHFWVETNE